MRPLPIAVTDEKSVTEYRNSSRNDAVAVADRINAMMGRRALDPSEKAARVARWYARKTCSHCVVCERPLAPEQIVYLETRHEAISPVCECCRGKYRAFRHPRPCEGCGRPVCKLLNGRSNKRTFCCEACKIKTQTRIMHERKVAERGTRECLGCQEVFEPARADARYCSSACRQLSYRRRVTGRNCSDDQYTSSRNGGAA